MMIIRAGIAIVLCVGLTACFNDVLNTKPEVAGLKGAAAVQTFTDPESGTKITTRTGGKVIIRLDANPTTGYAWVVKREPASDIIMIKSIEYEADLAPPGIVGSGGTTVIALEAVKNGQTSLKLAYQRSDQDVVENLSLKLQVDQ